MLTLNKENFNIAIISASSQVASSVAIYFRNFTQHKVTCFIRSSYSEILFDLFDIEHENIDLANKEDIRNKLSRFDIVLDFSYPAGQVGDIPKMIYKNLDAIISSLPAGCSFINMSSIMAYGMPDQDRNLRNFVVPRATYGFIKRKSEKIAQAFGKKYGIKVYNFRLGQVHGFLQSVNGSFREKLSSAKIAYLEGEPSDLTNTIFISSLGEAILNCVKNNYSTGTYTLVSYPQWTLQELYDYYINYYNFETKLEFDASPSQQKKNVSFFSRAFSSVKKYRPLIETYVLLNMPALAIKMKGKYREAEAYKHLNSTKDISLIDFNLLGSPTLPVIKDIKSSVNEVLATEKKMEILYQSVIEKARS